MPAWNAEGPLTVVEADPNLLLFRMVGGPGFNPDDWRSYYELHRPPIKLEQRAAIEHMGVSTTTKRLTLCSLIKGVDAFHGRWIAELRLRPGHGFWMANTSSRNHWNIWGWPEDFERWIQRVREP